MERMLLDLGFAASRSSAGWQPPLVPQNPGYMIAGSVALNLSGGE